MYPDFHHYAWELFEPDAYLEDRERGEWHQGGGQPIYDWRADILDWIERDFRNAKNKQRNGNGRAELDRYQRSVAKQLGITNGNAG
jgi:hypothetical protein